MHEQTSSYQTSISFSPFLEKRKNPYKAWAFWGGIFTTVAVTATTLASAVGLGFGWPLALAVLGALFTAVSLFASYSHNNKQAKLEEHSERRAREKELARQQELEKQIQKDKEVAKQMQMKEEEAKMEEAMKVVRNEGWMLNNDAQVSRARDYISKLLNKHNIVQETNNFTVSSLRSKIAGTRIEKSFNVGLAKNGKIATIDIDGRKIYNKGK